MCVIGGAGGAVASEHSRSGHSRSGPRTRVTRAVTFPGLPLCSARCAAAAPLHITTVCKIIGGTNFASRVSSPALHPERSRHAGRAAPGGSGPRGATVCAAAHTERRHAASAPACASAAHGEDQSQGEQEARPSEAPRLWQAAAQAGSKRYGLVAAIVTIAILTAMASPTEAPLPSPRPHPPPQPHPHPHAAGQAGAPPAAPRALWLALTLTAHHAPSPLTTHRSPLTTHLSPHLSPSPGRAARGPGVRRAQRAAHGGRRQPGQP